eukprot:scaffold16936_cov61-Attheya_sp.AAC.5
MASIAIHPHSDPRNHSTRLYFVYLLIHALKVFDGWVADLLVENTMRVAWLFLGSEYGGCSISVAGGFYVLAGSCIFMLLCVWSLMYLLYWGRISDV